MRRISKCVTGVPLPGWMFSAFMTTQSLPSTSSTLPLRTELAITFTTADLSRVLLAHEPWMSLGLRRRAAGSPNRFGAFYRRFPVTPRPGPRPQTTVQKPAEPSPWWHPDRHRDRRPFLLARGRIRKAIRAWFEAQDFVEVETCILQVSPGNETHLHAFATDLLPPGGERQPLYL